jgi:hypothetical protein
MALRIKASCKNEDLEISKVAARAEIWDVVLVDIRCADVSNKIAQIQRARSVCCCMSVSHLRHFEPARGGTEEPDAGLRTVG